MLGRPLHLTQIALVLTTETPLESPEYVRAIFQTIERERIFLMASPLAGILRTVETSVKGRENHMKDALQEHHQIPHRQAPPRCPTLRSQRRRRSFGPLFLSSGYRYQIRL